MFRTTPFDHCADVDPRPLSSTAASIILNPDHSIHMVLGGSGGSRIFPSLAQVLLNLQCGLDLSEAIERPRVHDQIVPNVTTLEVGPEGVEGEWKDLVDGLKARGHQVGLFDINIAISEGKLVDSGRSIELIPIVQAILVDDGTIWASSDSRKYGVAAAY
jgi:gamma-glutamyltranspeptidase/glutathione hydrolase/leukotriene-C4 hydrolase